MFNFKTKDKNFKLYIYPLHHSFPDLLAELAYNWTYKIYLGDKSMIWLHSKPIGKLNE